MKKLNLNETWKLCLKMWKWIAKERKGGSDKAVETLKAKWSRKHGFEKDSINSECFFCEYAVTHHTHVKVKGSGCSDCPGTKIDSYFDCEDNNYHYANNPIVFYNKLRALNRKRISKGLKDD